ncbi:MAG: alpha/beta fold hydrolase [Polynucleobacter sp.]
MSTKKIIKFLQVCLVLLAAFSTSHAEEPTVKVIPQTQVVKVNGTSVEVDVYKPLGPLKGAAILTHGFTRSRTTMGEHAQALAARGVLAITPDMPCTFDFRCNASAIAGLVNLLRNTETLGGSSQRVMLVGFSAGGLSSLLAADTPGVVGFVGLDSFDRILPNETERAGITASRRLTTEALLLRAPASRCNAQAVAAPWGSEMKALWRDELIAGASHCDFEAPTDWKCRWACGDTDPARQLQVRQGILDAAARWLQ